MPRVLIVDDDPRHLAALRRALQEISGVEVLCLSSPEEALRVIRSGEQFTNIVSDRDMGSQNGVRFLAEVFERHLLDARLALMSSGNPTKEETAELNRIGAKFFPKSQGTDELIRWMTDTV